MTEQNTNPLCPTHLTPMGRAGGQGSGSNVWQRWRCNKLGCGKQTIRNAQGERERFTPEGERK